LNDGALHFPKGAFFKGEFKDWKFKKREFKWNEIEYASMKFKDGVLEGEAIIQSNFANYKPGNNIKKCIFKK